MIEDPGSQFGFRAACAFIEAVVNNECVNAIVTRKGFYRFDNLPGQKRCEAQPVRLRVIQEPVKGILRKLLLEGTGFLLHVHAAV